MKRQDVSGQNTLHTDATGGAGTDVNVTGINGTAPSTGSGASDAGTLRVIVSTDSPSTGNSAASATGAVVPASADYQGLNVGGTLRGATGVNPSGSVFAEQVDLASVAGTTTATGNGTTNAGTQRVTLSSDSTGQVALAAGSAVIGHVITDTGSTTAVTGNVTVVQGTGTNLHAVLDAGAAIVGNVGIDQTTPGTTNAVSLAQVGSTTTATGNGVVGAGVQRVAIASDNTAFAVNATLQAGAAVIGHVIADTGSTTAVTGNVTVIQGTGSNLHTVIDSGTVTTVSTVTAVTDAQVQGKAASGAAKSGNPVQVGGVFNTTQPTVTNGQAVENQSTARGAQIVATGTDTFNVTVNAALPAGTALLGQVSASNETATVYNGTTALTPKFAVITASTSGATTIVAAVGGKRIRVLRMSLMSNGTVNVKWQSHVTPTDLTGLYYFVANTGWVEGYCPVGIFQTVSGEALDINLSGNVAVGGSLTYVEV